MQNSQDGTAEELFKLLNHNHLTFLTLYFVNVELFALKIGWCGMLMGIFSGAIIGLLFHKKDWLGGYSSFSRRMLRLGHISFFGIGFITLFYGLSITPMQIPPDQALRGVLTLIVKGVFL